MGEGGFGVLFHKSQIGLFEFFVGQIHELVLSQSVAGSLGVGLDGFVVGSENSESVGFEVGVSIFLSEFVGPAFEGIDDFGGVVG